MSVEVRMPDGRSWTPRFVTRIDQEKCIGCGRCYKVCGREVLGLAGMDEDGNLIPIEDGDDGDYEKKVIAIINQFSCIGCEACARICPRNCHTHAAMVA